MDRLSEIEKLIETLELQRQDIKSNWDYTKPYEDYVKATEVVDIQIEPLDRERRMLMTYTLKNKPE